MELQGSRLEQNDAILFLLGVDRRGVGTLSSGQELLLKDVSEEFTHAFLISLVLKVHVCHEALWFGITVGTLEKHPQVCDRTDVIFSDINHEAGVSLLLNCDLTTFLLRSNLDAWLSDLNLFLVEVRGDLDRRVTFFSRVDGICNSILDVFLTVVDFLSLSILIDNYTSTLRYHSRRREGPAI